MIKKNKVNIEEIANLIIIRNYVYNSLENFSIDRPTVSEMGNMLSLLDKRIIEMLKDNSFKDQIKCSTSEVIRYENLK
jgi:hypothetical protein